MRKISTRVVLLLAFCVVLSPAQVSYAASFDCSKASAKVEKMICADPKLSMLDEEMGKVYAEALRKAPDSAVLKSEQRAWLKERNGCADTQCLELKYSGRIAELHSGQVQNLYPPYPEVWHRMIPEPRLSDGSHDFFKMNNGDYLIVYTKFYDSEHRKLQFGGLHFFDGKVVNSVDKYSLYGKIPYEKNALSITLEDGLKISLKNIDTRNPQRCPQFLNYYYLIEYQDGRPKERKSILYVLDEPVKVNIVDMCADTKENDFMLQVLAIQGYLIPLYGENFMLSDPYNGIVLRFHENLQTSSGLLSDKLFMVDTDELQKYLVSESNEISYQQSQKLILDYIHQLKGVNRD